jgi:hypothetical protein
VTAWPSGSSGGPPGGAGGRVVAAGSVGSQADSAMPWAQASGAGPVAEPLHSGDGAMTPVREPRYLVTGRADEPPGLDYHHRADGFLFPGHPVRDGLALLRGRHGQGLPAWNLGLQ